MSLYKHLRSKRHSFANLLTENYVSQMTVFWRRALLDGAGTLDATLPLAFDYDLWLRFARRGPPVYIEEPTACFRWYRASKSGAQFEQQLRENAVIARYAAQRPWIPLRMRVYRLMARGRGQGRS